MPDATRYHRLLLACSLASLALTAGYLLAVLLTGAGHALARGAAAVTASVSVQLALVALGLAVAHGVLVFPLAWTRAWWLPRRYGLLHQPWRAWLSDRAKAALIGGVLGLAALEVIEALLRLTSWWWLGAAAVFLLAQAALAFVLPVWIVPLFYRLRPLEDAPLRERLLALARRARVPAVDVQVADQARRSRTANAAVVGLGRTRRILLFDTLLSGFTPDQIEAVLAHELGHHAHGDVPRGLAMQGALTAATFWLADRLLHAGVAPFGLAGPGDPAGVAWLALVLLLLGLAALPLGNAFARRLEREADDFALATTGNPAAFIGALERLGDLNLAERRPSRLKEFVLYSHPALDRRIARARGDAA